MANRFIVATGTWDASNTAIWAATDGGAPGASVPTATDDVFMTATSGAVTVTTAASVSVCQSLNCTGFTGTLVITNNADGLSIGNGAFTLASGMTLTSLSVASRIRFDATTTNGGAGWNITTAGKTMPGFVLGNAGAGKWVLQDAMTATAGTATITLTAGTLDTNTQSVTCGIFSSNISNTRALIMTGTTITCTTAGTAWNTGTITGLTFTSTNSTIVMSGASATLNSGALAFGTVRFTGSGVQLLSVSSGSSYVNLERTGTAVKTDGFSILISGGSTLTVSGILTLAGNSITNRLLVQSSVVGTARTITCDGTVTASNVDFTDITGAGSASWNLSGISGGSGDALGNSGITFTTPATQTATGTASFSWSTHGWTSRVPLPQDDVVVSNAFVAGRTITADMPRLGKSLDFSASTGSPIVDLTVSASLFGSIAFSAGMTTATLASIWTFGGRSTYTITSNGVVLVQAIAITAPNGSYTLADAFNTSRGSASAINVTAGTFTDGGNTVTLSGVTAGGFSISAGTLNKSSAWSTTAVNVTNVWTVTGGTVNDTGSFTVAASSANTRTFVGGGQVYGTLRYTVANSPGTLIITGSNRFTGLEIGSGRQLTLPSGTGSTAVTKDGLTLTGEQWGYLYLPGVVSNFASRTGSPDLSTAGATVEAIAYIAMDDWTPSAEAWIVGVYGSSAATRPAVLTVNTSGALIFRMSDGTNSFSTASTASVAFTDGTGGWIRASANLTAGTVDYYTSTDASSTAPGSVSWTALGTQRTTTLTNLTAATGTDLAVGANATGSSAVWPGKVYKAYMSKNGTSVFDPNFTTKTFGANTLTEGSSNAATVTIIGALAQVGDGRIALVSSTGGTKAGLATTHQDAYGNVWERKGNALIQEDDRLVFPGVASNYVTAADSAGFDATTELELVVRVAPDVLALGTRQSLILRYQGGDTNSSAYIFRINSDANAGLHYFVVPFSGGVNSAGSSQGLASVGFTDGSVMWLKQTWRASDGRIQWFWALNAGEEPTSWTQLGADATGATVSIATPTRQIEIGARNAVTEPFDGSIYRAIQRNTIDGTPVADFDGSRQAGYVQATYAVIQDVQYMGAHNFYATNSTDVSGNSGITFGEPPKKVSYMMLMGVS